MKNHINLFQRHYQILRFLREFRDEHGFSPSIREIGAAVEVDSTSLIGFYLAGLEDAGLITRKQRIARSIVLTRQGMEESQRDVKAARVIRVRLPIES